MNLLSPSYRSYESVPAMGRDWFFFCHFSALWGSGVFGRKGWRYSPKLVEEKFSEVQPLLLHLSGHAVYNYGLVHDQETFWSMDRGAL